MGVRFFGTVFLIVGCGGESSGGPATGSETGTGSTTFTTPSTSCDWVWFQDGDGDGFGDPAVGACQQQEGMVQDSSDCDDTRQDIYPAAVEYCDGLDNDCSGEADELFDDIDGDDIADCDETLLYCSSFDNLDGWSALGDGEWLLESGAVTDKRGGAYGAVLYTDDTFGLFDKFRIEVRTAFTGSLNDLAGIAWDVDPDESTYLVMQWDDPQHDYQRHSPPGAMQLTECIDEVTCPILVRDATQPLIWSADGQFVTWSVEVDAGDVTVLWDGLVVFDQFVEAAVGRGPRQVGLYSNDNDGGVQYDDFCLWVTPDVEVGP